MREIGKRLYYRTPSTNTVSSASKVGATTSTGSYVRYGTAQADSAEGKVQVKLDNSDDVVNCSCDSPIKQGDRVKVIVTESGALIAMPIGQNIIDYTDQVKVDLSQEIVNKGNDILEEVNGEMDAWKQDHQLTDADINHQIQQSISQTTETWEGQLSDLENGIQTNYALKTEVTQGINGLRTEVSEKYATTEGVQDDINTAIEIASGEITSTVEENVMNSAGETFATKTELEQTEQNLSLTISQSISSWYATCPTSSSTRAKDATSVKQGFTKSTGTSVTVKFTYGNTASNPTLNVAGTGASPIYLKGSPITPALSWEAGDTLTFVFDGTNWVVAGATMETAKTIETYFNATSSGLEIGQSGSRTSLMLGSSGTVQILDSSQTYPLVTISREGFQIGPSDGAGLYVDNLLDTGKLGFIESIGTNPVGSSAYMSNAVQISDLQNMCNNGDYVTDYGTSDGTSGSIRYWKWANGRREASGSISVSMSANGSAGGHQIRLPFSFADQYSYRVLVTLNSTSSSPPNGYNNVGCLAYNKRSSSFYVTAWNSSNFPMSVDLDWYAIGVGN